jgi:hypothetical protein
MTNRIDGLLRAIENGTTKEYWDAQEKKKKYQKKGRWIKKKMVVKKRGKVNSLYTSLSSTFTFLPPHKNHFFLIPKRRDEKNMKPKQNDLRVWWARNVPITKQNPAVYYPVCNVNEAVDKLKELAKKDLKDPKVSDNVGGLEVFQDGEWSEYYDDTGNDIDEIIEARGGYNI